MGWRAPTRALLTCLALSSSLLACAQHRALPEPLSLTSGGHWSLHNANQSIRLANVTVPGCVTEALWDAGIIGDPLYRENEALQRWVSEDTWTYETQFTVTTSLPAGDIELAFDGLDTLADVTLDGQLILTAQNFHRSYHVPLSQQLSSGTHTLRITLHSPLRAADAAAESYAYPLPSNQAPGAYANYNFIRKPASDFGWDWGPAIAPIGIHGNITLISYSEPWLRGVHLVQLHAWSQGIITLRGDVEVVWPLQWPDDTQMTLTLSLPAVPGVTHKQIIVRNAGRSQRYQIEVHVPLVDIELWWPRGHGSQPLYEVVTLLTPTDSNCVWVTPGWRQSTWLHNAWHHTEQPCSAVAVRIGFRHIELVTAPLEEAWELIHGQHRSHTRDDTAAPQPADMPQTDTAETLGQDSQHDISELRRRLHSDELQRITGQIKRSSSSSSSGGSPSHTSQTSSSSSSSDSRYAGTDQRPANNVGSENRGRNYDYMSPYYGIQGLRNSTRDAESFFFRVNGEAVYIRGANLIPLDVLHVRGGASASVEALLRQAARANMNMVRVWGGGRYQVASLYEWCDREGVMVWQEFMFACSPYPTAADFIHEVKEEVTEVVRKLAHHPSIAIWGGNNEVEALLSDYPAVKANLPLYVSDSNALFVDAIRHIVDTLDPSRPYVDTSPSNGLHSRDPYVKRWGDAQNHRFGDVHLYNYQQDCQDASLVLPAKFVSETGWQSSPSWQAISPCTTPEDWDFTSHGAQYRQRHPDGDEQMLAQLARHFRLPPAWQDAAKSQTQGAGGFEASYEGVSGRDRRGGPVPQSQMPADYRAWIYLTQVQQALCISTAASRWLSMRSDPTALNMGLLYWQLNDIWPGYSWSSLDYPRQTGATPHWKPLHYAMRRLWAPMAVLWHVTEGHIQVNITSTLPTSVSVTVEIHLVPLLMTSVNCSAATVLATLSVAIPAKGNVPVWEGDTDNESAPSPEGTEGAGTGDDWSLQSLRKDAFLHVLVTYCEPGSRHSEGVSESEGVGPSMHASDKRADTAEKARSPGGIHAKRTTVHAAIFLSYFRDMPELPVGKPAFSAWQQEDPDKVCFTVSADTVLPLLVLETDFLGYFSDNMFTLAPCRPREVCFTHDAAQGGDIAFSADSLRDNTWYTSVADYMP